ncbi:MAG: tRNA lysidine(34) synthetase [Bacillota bacterium]
MKIKPVLPQSYFRRIWRALGEFEMLQAGDRLVVGLSGGKDSLFLLYALAAISLQTGIPGGLAALTVDLGFAGRMDYSGLERFCMDLEVPFHLVSTGIGAVLQSAEHAKENPCAKCSFLRRGAMVRWARNHDFPIMALAHHLDDAVETYCMNILFSGQTKTFLPKTRLDRSGITVIRPLIYMREYEIKKAVQKYVPLEPLPSPCPFSGTTKRAETKNLLSNLAQNNRFIFHNIFSAMRLGPETELWPAAPVEAVIKARCDSMKRKRLPKNGYR